MLNAFSSLRLRFCLATCHTFHLRIKPTKSNNCFLNIYHINRHCVHKSSCVCCLLVRLWVSECVCVYVYRKWTITPYMIWWERDRRSFWMHGVYRQQHATGILTGQMQSTHLTCADEGTEYCMSCNWWVCLHLSVCVCVFVVRFLLLE